MTLISMSYVNILSVVTLNNERKFIISWSHNTDLYW